MAPGIRQRFPTTASPPPRQVFNRRVYSCPIPFKLLRREREYKSKQRGIVSCHGIMGIAGAAGPNSPHGDAIDTFCIPATFWARKAGPWVPLLVVFGSRQAVNGGIHLGADTSNACTLKFQHPLVQQYSCCKSFQHRRNLRHPCTVTAASVNLAGSCPGQASNSPILAFRHYRCASFLCDLTALLIQISPISVRRPRCYPRSRPLSTVGLD